MDTEIKNQARTTTDISVRANQWAVDTAQNLAILLKTSRRDLHVFDSSPHRRVWVAPTEALSAKGASATVRLSGEIDVEFTDWYGQSTSGRRTITLPAGMSYGAIEAILVGLATLTEATS